MTVLGGFCRIIHLVIRIRLSIVFLVLILPVAVYGQPAITIDTFTSLRGVSVESQASWLSGGFGRLGSGGDASGESSEELSGDVRFGIAWDPSDYFGIVVNGVARSEPGGHQGDDFGLVEGYLEGRLISRNTDVTQPSGRLRLRLGTFFLPTSRENTDILWTSPYTITLSAINSWVAEEVRPVGLDTDYRIDFPSGNSFSLGATLFGGNDTSGTLLAWRGWSMHNRLTTYNETLPLPPLFSLEDSGHFSKQRDDGTEPFNDDLDDREGWSTRARWSNDDRMLLQLTWLDNRGDRRLYRGEYAWDTDFLHFAAEYRPNLDTVIAHEWMSGSTGMGDLVRVHLDYDAWYFMVSRRFGRWRATIRYDDFETTDRDEGPAETNTENGRAVTLAAFWETTPSLRVGLEYVDLSADRVAAAESGFDPNTDGSTITAEVRYYWGR